MNIILENDIENIVKESICWEKLKDSTILITGFKGMIGSYMTRVCLYLNDHYHYNIKVIGVARNDRGLAEDIKNHPNLKIVYQDVISPI